MTCPDAAACSTAASSPTDAHSAQHALVNTEARLLLMDMPSHCSRAPSASLDSEWPEGDWYGDPAGNRLPLGAPAGVGDMGVSTPPTAAANKSKDDSGGATRPAAVVGRGTGFGTVGRDDAASGDVDAMALNAGVAGLDAADVAKPASKPVFITRSPPPGDLAVSVSGAVCSKCAVAACASA